MGYIYTVTDNDLCYLVKTNVYACLQRRIWLMETACCLPYVNIYLQASSTKTLWCCLLSKKCLNNALLASEVSLEPNTK